MKQIFLISNKTLKVQFTWIENYKIWFKLMLHKFKLKKTKTKIIDYILTQKFNIMMILKLLHKDNLTMKEKTIKN
jgi:hypothetical protein